MLYTRSEDLTSIIEKRRSLHRQLQTRQEQNKTLEFQVGQLQALANVGTNTAMIAHEINNLLTPIANYADLALKNPGDLALGKKALEKTVKNCNRASKVMQSILAVVNGQNTKKDDCNLKATVDEIFSCLCRDFKNDRITVNIDIPEDLTIYLVPVEIQQVLMNLILNAREAMLERGGILTIKAWETDDSAHITVSDTGCGIEPADLKKIFEPFFSAKEGNSGSGLGLAFCKSIIDKYEGSISVESKPAQLTVFQITLPKTR